MPEQTKVHPPITIENAPPPYDEFIGEKARKSEYLYFADGHGQPCADRVRFNPDETNFDLVNAWWLCEAATLAYSGPDIVEGVFKNKGRFKQVVPLSASGSNECFIASNDEFAIVAFRGSELTPRENHPPHNISELFDPRKFADIFADWVRDFTARLRDFGDGARVHSGFDDGVNRLRRETQFDKIIAELPSRKIWFTGHSLGAALATVAAARMLAEGKRLDGLYTYGSPRVGDERFAENLRQRLKARGLKYYRFANGNDVVTTVPPPNVSPYKHAGTLEHIDGDRGITEDPTQFEGLKAKVLELLPIGAGGRLDHRFFNGIPNAIEDHVPTLYSTRIWNALARA